ncbi:hypothetical protein RRG08_052520 [Elysia crispata]|uniref:Uncharacterized protein n=1 Tax=Elysia crispata TaxID=231223 RepID=A0AAE1CU62_9GAST|nr:hypothetical protein RRG08_052520 [Elysia crispata]
MPVRHWRSRLRWKTSASVERRYTFPSSPNPAISRRPEGKACPGDWSEYRNWRAARLPVCSTWKSSDNHIPEAVSTD